MLKRERMGKERREYEDKLNRTVASIMSTPRSDGKPRTKYDEMRLKIFHDERNIPDYEFNERMEKIDELEQRETGDID